MNNENSAVPRETKAAYQPAPPQLDHICCFVHELNAIVWRWGGRRFKLSAVAAL